MDLNRAWIFVKVVEEGGFTAAARALSLPKSSVSRAVSLLEADMGVRLLRRSTRGVSLTDAGAAFFDPVARALAAVHEAREAAVALDAELSGTIRVTAAADLAAAVLAPIVAQFVEQSPRVVVDVVSTSRVVDVVEEGFDLAIRAGPLRDESVVARKLPRVEFGVFAAPSYLERHGAPRRASDLAKHRAVLFRAVRGRATWTLRSPRGTETVEVSGPIHTDDFVYALRSVAHGAGIGLLPTFLVDHAAPGELRRLLPTYAAPGAEVHIIHPAGRYLPRRVAALRDFIVRELER